MSQYKKFVSYFIVAILWESCCRLGVFNTNILPPPTEVVSTIFQLLISGELIKDSLVSLLRVLIGFLFAAFLGIGLGIVGGSSRFFMDYAAPILEVLRPIPPIAFIPMAVLWFGIGNKPAYFLVFLGAFFPIYTNALVGIISVSPIHREAASCLGARKRLMLTDVFLPASISHLAAGLKTGLGTAWFCVIVAELVGARSGLGYMIQMNRLTLQSEKVLSGMIVIGLLGYLMNRFIVSIYARLIPWHSGLNNL